MGSASRVALTTAKSAVSSATDVSIATGVALLAAGRAIGDSPALRAALSHRVANAAAKGALVSSVLGKLDKSAQSLLTVIVGQSWSSVDDLLDGIEDRAETPDCNAVDRPERRQDRVLGEGTGLAGVGDREAQGAGLHGMPER